MRDSRTNKIVSQEAFTLVELIATIAILAVLVATMIPVISDFVQSGREVSDKQTLAVLNDAINRYKMQGGDASVLTEGTSFEYLVELLKTPLSWHGQTHQFIATATTFAAENVAAKGSGNQFCLTRYNDFTEDATGTDIPAQADPTLIASYTFDTDLDGCHSETSGSSTVSSVSGEAEIYLDLPSSYSRLHTSYSNLDMGKRYRVRFDAYSPDGIHFYINQHAGNITYITGNTNNVFPLTTQKTSYWFDFEVNNDDRRFKFYIQNQTDKTAYVDNIRLYEF